MLVARGISLTDLKKFLKSPDGPDLIPHTHSSEVAYVNEGPL